MANSISPFVDSSPQYARQFDIETINGDQRQRIAEMLRGQMFNQPQGQMVSGWYVRPSWTQNLNQALQTGLGVWGGMQADKEEQEAIQKDLALLSGKPTPQQLAQAVRPQPQQPTTTPLPEGDVTPEAQVNPVGMALPQGQVSPQVNLQQPQGMPDYRQFQSPMIRNMMLKKHIESLTPEYSTTPQYDQSGRAFVLDKAGNMKYLGTDQVPVRKMTDFNEPFVMNEQGKWVPNTAYQQYSMTKSRVGAPSISVNTEKGYGGAMASKIADLDASKYQTAVKAPQILENVARTKAILTQGNVLTGALANPQQAVLSYGQALGVTGKDTNEILNNTQMLAAGRAGATLDAISASGLGSGQGFSNKDREFLEQAKLGNIKYTRETLLRQADLEERVARESAKAWNNRLQQIPASSREPLGLQPVYLPEAQPTGALGAQQGPRLRRGQR